MMDNPRKDKGSATGMLLKGAAVLGLAAVLSKLIGTLQKIPLQNMAGDAVFGIYNAVYPLYILILFLATAGFPLVVSKFVAEQVAQRKYRAAARVLQVSIAVLMCTGVACFLLLFFGSGWIAGLMGTPKAEPAIRSVSFALLLVPVMSALRGYYQGYQNMVPTAVSQVVEQTVRVATMFGLLLWFLKENYGPDSIAAGATFGSVAGAAAGLAVMLWFRFREPRPSSLTDNEPLEKIGPLVKRLVAYALPICLGSVALPILTLVDSFTMPRLLAERAGGEAEGLYQFGLYNHGLPLVQLVAMIASSMSAALVPAIAEARLRGDREAVRSRTEAALRLTWFIGLAASFGLAALAAPLNMMFFKTTEGSAAMAVLGFTALLSTLNIVAGSVLQGCGAVTAPAVYLLVAAALKVAGNELLMPRWGIDGAAVAAVAAYLAAGGLALAHALRATGARFPLAAYVYRPLTAVAAMCAGLLALRALAAYALPPGRGAAAVVALAGVALGAVLYGVTLLRAGALTEGELRLVPKVKEKHIALLKKYRFIR
ncbi:polysaccharide biosynthesis protein [Paenibacillus thalictri]|uniref:Polysaccharide biosynthesis protein n=2 Tax=Paenibacillus thalictri TaxID=2527873 RepID=A0A4Q9DFT6_9BACL|nr:polysaccharide biosynthesis protein [Paenibacillus thalictri]